MSWNPDFPRKRKKCRVSHGEPYRRRYFFIPVLCAVLLIPAVRSATMFIEWATRPDPAERNSTMTVDLRLWNEIIAEMESRQRQIAKLNAQIESLKARTTPVLGAGLTGHGVYPQSSGVVSVTNPTWTTDTIFSKGGETFASSSGTRTLVSSGVSTSSNRMMIPSSPSPSR